MMINLDGENFLFWEDCFEIVLRWFEMEGEVHVFCTGRREVRSLFFGGYCEVFWEVFGGQG